MSEDSLLERVTAATDERHLCWNLTMGGEFAFKAGHRGRRATSNSREDALKAYRRTRLKLLALALSDEDGN